MKDYPSWQKTKLQRLNLSVCHTHADPPPVVEAILNYGNEEILSQMIKDTTMQSMVSQSRNIFKQLLTTGKRYHSQQTDKHPTFLNYKHDAQ